MYFETDDLRQAYVVAKNEMRKFLRGKRFALFVVITIVVFSLVTFLPYIVKHAMDEDIIEILGSAIALHLQFVSFLVLLSATLFASVVIVSEFEERTALILFTRPIKKTSIFIGKVIGCIVLETVVIVLFYICTFVVALVYGEAITIQLFESMGMAVLYIVATSSVVVFISSVMKKGSTCVILTFVLLWMILPIITGIMSLSSIDPWFMLDSAVNAIVPSHLLTEFGFSAPDMVKAAGTMIAWSAVSMVLAWFAFIRREF